MANNRPGSTFQQAARVEPMGCQWRTKDAMSAQNGCLEIWQDPELGDQPFFFEAIEPLQTRLSRYLPMVKAEMTDA